MRKVSLVIIIITINMLFLGLTGCDHKTEHISDPESTIEETNTPTSTLFPSPTWAMWDFWFYISPNGGEGESRLMHLSGGPVEEGYYPQKPEVYGYSREGYTFKCWNTRRDGTGKAVNAHGLIKFDEFESVNGSFWLYAIWEKND